MKSGLKVAGTHCCAAEGAGDGASVFAAVLPAVCDDVLAVLVCVSVLVCVARFNTGARDTQSRSSEPGPCMCAGPHGQHTDMCLTTHIHAHMHRHIHTQVPMQRPSSEPCAGTWQTEHTRAGAHTIDGHVHTHTSTAYAHGHHVQPNVRHVQYAASMQSRACLAFCQLRC